MSYTRQHAGLMHPDDPFRVHAACTTEQCSLVDKFLGLVLPGSAAPNEQQPLTTLWWNAWSTLSSERRPGEVARVVGDEANRELRLHWSVARLGPYPRLLMQFTVSAKKWSVLGAFAIAADESRAWRGDVPLLPLSFMRDAAGRGLWCLEHARLGCEHRRRGQRGGANVDD